MKKFLGVLADHSSTILGTVAVLVIASLFIGMVTTMINGNANKVRFEDYDLYSVIAPSEANGNIGDHVKGSADAPVLVFEYADYQCPGCASMNTKVNKAIEALDGKLAVVYRSFLLSYHQNGTAAASAAEAAGLQGYWKPYADALFSYQTEWEYLSASERTNYFKKYFIEASNGKGDVEKFLSDMGSNEVSKKISFDMGLGRRIDVSGTPAFYVDGQLISWGGAGSLTINGEVISWDSSRGAESDFVQLMTDIVNAKLKK